MRRSCPPHHSLAFAGDDLDRLTAQFLQTAGLREGMRVLDIGCGIGDVSLLAARMVEPTGAVIGVDRCPQAITVATYRATTAGLTNVRFLTRDITDFVLAEPIDALIGRLVLLDVSDPAVVVRRLARSLKPGGIVAFQEFDLDGARSEPVCPLFGRAVEWSRRTFARIGVDCRTGLKLGRIFQEAGLPAPRMTLNALVERGPDSPVHDQIAQLTSALLPLMERTGVAGADEVGIETLAARMREEAIALDATAVSPSFVGAWTRTSVTPSSPHLTRRRRS
jgi:ubiquinone/menaquinone biosynthesis C-methylase UbiE